MRLRSLLFVPGDRPERFAKAAASGADAIILDLEDSVAPAAKAAAREHVAAFLAQSRDQGIAVLVRINPLDGADAGADIAAIAARHPDAVMLPKAEGSASVLDLAARLWSHGSRAPILPIATETPTAMFQLGSYREVAKNLCGLTWGAEDLPAAIGAATSRDDRGLLLPTYELGRSLTLMGAHAAETAAIETVYPDVGDIEGATAYAVRAARDGFTGMLAIHPSQVPIINAAFSPTASQLAQAAAIVAAFDANPGAGALLLDGKMIDAPHLKQALTVLARA